MEATSYIRASCFCETKQNVPFEQGRQGSEEGGRRVCGRRWTIPANPNRKDENGTFAGEGRV